MTIRHRPHRWWVIAPISLGLVAACSSSEEEPQRPPITRPLDASAYTGRVCDLLSNDDAAPLGYVLAGTQGKETSSVAGEYRSCSWFQPESPMLNIDLFPSHDLLAYEYGMSKGKSVGPTDEPWLEPLTIAGQPAVALGRSHQLPNRTCSIVVGLTDTQSIRVNAGQHYLGGRGTSAGPGDGDGRACEHAMAVADAIVRNLGG